MWNPFNVDVFTSVYKATNNVISLRKERKERRKTLRFLGWQKVYNDAVNEIEVLWDTNTTSPTQAMAEGMLEWDIEDVFKHVKKYSAHLDSLLEPSAVYLDSAHDGKNGIGPATRLYLDLNRMPTDISREIYIAIAEEYKLLETQYRKNSSEVRA